MSQSAYGPRRGRPGLQTPPAGFLCDQNEHRITPGRPRQPLGLSHYSWEGCHISAKLMETRSAPRRKAGFLQRRSPGVVLGTGASFFAPRCGWERGVSAKPAAGIGVPECNRLLYLRRNSRIGDCHAKQIRSPGAGSRGSKVHCVRCGRPLRRANPLILSNPGVPTVSPRQRASKRKRDNPSHARNTPQAIAGLNWRFGGIDNS